MPGIWPHWTSKGMVWEATRPVSQAIISYWIDWSHDKKLSLNHTNRNLGVTFRFLECFLENTCWLVVSFVGFVNNWIYKERKFSSFYWFPSFYKVCSMMKMKMYMFSISPLSWQTWKWQCSCFLFLPICNFATFIILMLSMEVNCTVPIAFYLKLYRKSCMSTVEMKWRPLHRTSIRQTSCF